MPWEWLLQASDPNLGRPIYSDGSVVSGYPGSLKKQKWRPAGVSSMAGFQVKCIPTPWWSIISDHHASSKNNCYNLNDALSTLFLSISTFLNLSIFCLHKHAFIPLHNQPRITVFSKMLFGSVHLMSYD